MIGQQLTFQIDPDPDMIWLLKYNPVAWIGRRWYPTEQEGLNACSMVVDKIEKVYLFEISVDQEFRKYWLHPNIWIASIHEPTWRPEYWVIRKDNEQFLKKEVKP